jgi:hypothetical protein
VSSVSLRTSRAAGFDACIRVIEREAQIWQCAVIGPVRRGTPRPRTALPRKRLTRWSTDNRTQSSIALVATVAVVGIVAAAFEAALLPGIVLGVAAVSLPQHFMGPALNPLFRTTVRGAYKIRQKTQEMMADAYEQVEDIVAEVDAEGALKASKVPAA